MKNKDWLSNMAGFRDGFVDAHCHLADARLKSVRDQIILDSRKEGISFFLQGGVGPEDWEEQLKLFADFPEQIGLCFGLHPYWVSENSSENHERALDALALYASAHPVLALGEVGLDFRATILNRQTQIEKAEQKELQLNIFQSQLELANVLNLPLVFHFVRAFDEAKRVFEYIGSPANGAMIHSFNGDWSEAEFYLKQNFYISLGGAICHPRNQKVRATLAKIPLDKVIIESDAPDQKPYEAGSKEDPLNYPKSIWQVAKTLSDWRGKRESAEEILENSKQNFNHLFGGFGAQNANKYVGS